VELHKELEPGNEWVLGRVKWGEDFKLGLDLATSKRRVELAE
jgi:hypothetical protein